jgi:hypothetical protein
MGYIGIKGGTAGATTQIHGQSKSPLNAGRRESTLLVLFIPSRDRGLVIVRDYLEIEL